MQELLSEDAQRVLEKIYDNFEQRIQKIEIRSILSLGMSGAAIVIGICVLVIGKFT